MKHSWFMTIVLAVLLLTLVGGCADKKPETGPAAGKTLVIATFDNERESGGDMLYDVIASDERMSGKLEVVVNDDAVDSTSDIRGSLIIRNDKGTWKGDWTGVITEKEGLAIYHRFTAKGTGDYEGLELQGQDYLGPQNTGWDTATAYVVTGWIQESE